VNHSTSASQMPSIAPYSRALPARNFIGEARAWSFFEAR
jgi:hypothetical protein